MRTAVCRRTHPSVLFLAGLFSCVAWTTPAWTQDTIVWYPKMQMSDTIGQAIKPSIFISGEDTVHVSWWAAPGLPYRRSINGGETFEPIRNLVTDTILYPIWFASVRIIGEGSRVYIFASQEGISNNSAPGPVTLATSTDRGTSWTMRRVGPDSSNGTYSVNVLGDTFVVIYAPWENGFSIEPRLMNSTDGGQTWTITPDTLDGWTVSALTGNTLHVVRNENIFGALEVAHLPSYDLGQTYAISEIISTIDGADALERDMTSSVNGTDTSLYVVWRETRLGCATDLGCSIVLKESHDNGQTWAEEVVLTEEPRGVRPAVAVRDSILAVAWCNDTWWGFSHTFVRVRLGSTWHSPKDLTPNPANLIPVSPLAVAVSEKLVHVVWEEGVGSPAQFRLFYRRGLILRDTPTVVKYGSGWNLVSLPKRTDTSINMPSLYSYDGGYVQAKEMVPGVGYWAKPESVVTYEGDLLLSDTVGVKKGWNLIGSLSYPLFPSQIVSEPQGIITSAFIGFDGSSYAQAQRLDPGRAYWVKVNEDGALILQSE